jgi:hypothetical protein
MPKIVILSQEIYAHSMGDLQNDEIMRPIKAQFVKKCVLESLGKFLNPESLPLELKGFFLHLESEIKNADISKYSDDDLLVWVEQQIQCIQKREQMHMHWNRNAQVNKISVILTRIKSRIFSLAHNLPIKQTEECNEIETIIFEAKKDLKNKVEKEIVLQATTKAIAAYQTMACWPISTRRLAQQEELLVLMKQASSAQSAIEILEQGISHIEQQHVATSFAANLPCYQRQSRLVHHLTKASQEIAMQVKTDYKKTTVEKAVELAINTYLSNDIFYHNRRRRIVAKQLLAQLCADNKLFSQGQEIQKKHKMRSTLDQFIGKIDEEFKNTYFFSRFYQTKRSRLALHLEEIKELLINRNELTVLELENEVKQPIIQAITLILDNSGQRITVDITREMNTLIRTLMEAQTTHAIEAILEGHIRSYLGMAAESGLLTCLKNLLTGQDNIYFSIAVQLESALLDWQARGILPAASGYKTFLKSLASDRQNNENDLQRLEQRYHIKIPREIDKMQAQHQVITQKAKSLLKRIQDL